MPEWLPWLGGLLGFALVVHLLASWAERRGWVNYRSSGGGTGAALANAMAEFEAVLNPAAEHRIEEHRSADVRREVGGQGEPPADAHPSEPAPG